MTTFSEADLEQATLEWLEELEFTTISGSEISPDGNYPERNSYNDVVLSNRLLTAIQRINPHLPNDAIEDALRQITIPKHPSLITNNQTFHKYITDGVDVALRDKEGAIQYDKAQIFDFNNVNNNDWLAVNQFTVIEGKSEKRPDIVIFVNERHRT